ncbi:iron-siderophore ABC transporter substrate-binding protein [Gloeocapsa sp. BRSZ]
MKKQLYRYLKQCLLLALSFFLITACYSQVTQQAKFPKTQLAISNCRVVVHQLGKTCIPLQPQRIIVTDEIILDAVLGLGLKPIATAEPNVAGRRGRHLAGRVESLASLGTRSQINIEKIVQLHPDLIVGSSINSQNYELFEKIAPTIKCDMKYAMGAWKGSLRNLGEILGRTKQVENILAQYQQKVQQLRKAIQEKPEKIEVSVSRFYKGGLPQFDTIFSFSGGILQEAGFSAPHHQVKLAITPDTAYVSVSLERLDLLDADVLFVMLDPGSQDNFDRYQKSPLWQKLSVVQKNRVYTVDSGYWYAGNILAANAILDDLFKYLLNNP